MIIACVFRESKTFTVDYVKVFSNVFAHYHPECRQVCFTNYSKIDLPKRMERIPLRHQFDSWFSKMELFDPAATSEDIFYSDLDNIVVAPLNNFFEYHSANSSIPFMINDVDPKQKRLQSAVMYIPQSQKANVWDRFVKNSNHIIQTANKFGDAKIIRESPEWKPKAYQDVFGSNCIVSYRHGWLKGIKKDVQIVCQHGDHEKPLNGKFNEVPLIREHFLKWK